MELSRVMMSQTAHLNGLTSRVGKTFEILPEQVRRTLIPDEAFKPMSDLVARGLQIANVIVAWTCPDF